MSTSDPMPSGANPVDGKPFDEKPFDGAGGGA